MNLCARVPCFTLTDLKQWMEPRPRRQQLLSLFKRVGQTYVWLAVMKADAGSLDDDDDIDESALPAFSHPTMRSSTPPLNKNKSRAPEQLALPTGSALPNQLSGNIGTPIGGANRGARRNFGGVQVESRLHISTSFILRRGVDLALGPAGLILLTNRSSPPSSVTFFTLPSRTLTIG